MPLMRWKDDYSVGVKKIDDEHKELIGMINKIYDSIENMREAELLPELVADMRKYAMHHFASEEMLMKHYQYPEFEAHRKMHNDFMVFAASADSALASGTKSPLNPNNVFKYLANWLLEHILKTDKELGVFLNEKGVK